MMTIGRNNRVSKIYFKKKLVGMTAEEADGKIWDWENNFTLVLRQQLYL